MISLVLDNKKMAMNVDITDSLSANSQVKEANNLVVDAASLVRGTQTADDDIEELDYDPFITDSKGNLKPLELFEHKDDDELYAEEVGIPAIALARVKRCGGGGGGDDDDDGGRARRIRTGRLRNTKRRKTIRKIKRIKKAKNAAKKKARSSIKLSDADGDDGFEETVVVKRRIIQNGNVVQGQQANIPTSSVATTIVAPSNN